MAANQNINRETADIETSSDGYAARFAGPIGTWMLGVQTAAVSGCLPAGQRLAILDVGGGHGQLAGFLADAGHSVTVLGSDPVCARRLEPLLAAGKIAFVSGDVLLLPFPDQHFDAVVSVRLLPHCVRWQSLIGELCRVARHRVIVDYPLDSGLNRVAPFLFAAKKRVEGNTRTWLNFRHAQIAAEFARSGFRPGRRIGQFIMPMVLHRAMGSAVVSRLIEAPSRLLGITRRFGTPVIAAFERSTPEP